MSNPYPWTQQTSTDINGISRNYIKHFLGTDFTTNTTHQQNAFYNQNTENAFIYKKSLIIKDHYTDEVTDDGNGNITVQKERIGKIQYYEYENNNWTLKQTIRNKRHIDAQGDLSNNHIQNQYFSKETILTKDYIFASQGQDSHTYDSNTQVSKKGSIYIFKKNSQGVWEYSTYINDVFDKQINRGDGTTNSADSGYFREPLFFIKNKYLLVSCYANNNDSFIAVYKKNDNNDNWGIHKYIFPYQPDNHKIPIPKWIRYDIHNDLLFIPTLKNGDNLQTTNINNAFWSVCKFKEDSNNIICQQRLRLDSYTLSSTANVSLINFLQHTKFSDGYIAVNETEKSPPNILIKQINYNENDSNIQYTTAPAANISYTWTNATSQPIFMDIQKNFLHLSLTHIVQGYNNNYDSDDFKLYKRTDTNTWTDQTPGITIFNSTEHQPSTSNDAIFMRLSEMFDGKIVYRLVTKEGNKFKEPDGTDAVAPNYNRLGVYVFSTDDPDAIEIPEPLELVNINTLEDNTLGRQRIILNFNETVDFTGDISSNFDISINNVIADISSINISGKILEIKLHQMIWQGDDISLNYTQRNGTIHDINDTTDILPDFTEIQSITNNITLSEFSYDKRYVKIEGGIPVNQDTRFYDIGRFYDVSFNTTADHTYWHHVSLSDNFMAFVNTADETSGITRSIQVIYHNKGVFNYLVDGKVKTDQKIDATNGQTEDSAKVVFVTDTYLAHNVAETSRRTIKIYKRVGNLFDIQNPFVLQSKEDESLTLGDNGIIIDEGFLVANAFWESSKYANPTNPKQYGNRAGIFLARLTDANTNTWEETVNSQNITEEGVFGRKYNGITLSRHLGRDTFSLKGDYLAVVDPGYNEDFSSTTYDKVIRIYKKNQAGTDFEHYQDISGSDFDPLSVNVSGNMTLPGETKFARNFEEYKQFAITKAFGTYFIVASNWDFQNTINQSRGMIHFFKHNSTENKFIFQQSIYYPFPGRSASDAFGKHISVSDGTVVAGVRLNNGGTHYVYNYNPLTERWEPNTKVFDGELIVNNFEPFYGTTQKWFTSHMSNNMLLIYNGKKEEKLSGFGSPPSFFIYTKDISPPQLDSILPINDYRPNRITLVFNDDMNPDNNKKENFTVKINNQIVDISGISVMENKLTIILTNIVNQGDNITLNYTQDSDNSVNVRDMGDNLFPNFSSEQNITNNITITENDIIDYNLNFSNIIKQPDTNYPNKTYSVFVDAHTPHSDGQIGMYKDFFFASTTNNSRAQVWHFDGAEQITKIFDVTTPAYENAKYGKRMAMSDNYMAVSEPEHDTGKKTYGGSECQTRGRIYIYKREGNTFPVNNVQYVTTLGNQIKVGLNDLVMDDNFIIASSTVGITVYHRTVDGDGNDVWAMSPKTLEKLQAWHISGKAAIWNQNTGTHPESFVNDLGSYVPGPTLNDKVAAINMGNNLRLCGDFLVTNDYRIETSRGKMNNAVSNSLVRIYKKNEARDDFDLFQDITARTGPLEFRKYYFSQLDIQPAEITKVYDTYFIFFGGAYTQKYDSKNGGIVFIFSMSPEDSKFTLFQIIKRDELTDNGVKYAFDTNDYNNFSHNGNGAKAKIKAFEGFLAISEKPKASETSVSRYHDGNTYRRRVYLFYYDILQGKWLQNTKKTTLSRPDNFVYRSRYPFLAGIGEKGVVVFDSDTLKSDDPATQSSSNDAKGVFYLYAPPDTVSPSLTEVNSIEESEPNKLILQFSENILTDFTSGELTDFTVNVTGTNNPVTNHSITGSSLTLTLTNRVYKDQEVTIAYNKNTFNIKDGVGNESSSIPTTTVTNNTTTPIPLSFAVSDVYYSHVDVNFNENIPGTTGYKLGYSETQGNYITDTYIPVSNIVVSVVNGNRRNGITGNVYRMEDQDMTNGFAEITLTRGKTYTFTNSSNGAHPLKFTTLDNLGSSTYLGATDGITESGNTITYKVPVTAPDELHYKCSAHEFMGSGPGNGGIKFVNRKVSTTIEINVTVSGGVFTFHGKSQPTIKLVKGNTYKFDTSAVSTIHPFKFSQLEDGPDYTTGVTSSGTQGQSGAYTQIVVAQNTPDTLYYKCGDHPGMGGVINVIDQENYSMRKLNPITKHYIVLNTKTSGTTYTTDNPGSGEATLPSPPYDLIQRGGHNTRIELSFNTIVLNNLNSGASIYGFKQQTPVRGLVSNERPTYIYPKGIVYNGDVNKLGSEGPWDLEIRYDQGKSYFMYDGHNAGGSGMLFLVRGKTYRFKMVGATTTEESFTPKTSWIGDNERRDWIFNGSGFITGSNPSTDDDTKYVHNIKYFIFTVSKHFNNSAGYSDYVYPFYKSSGIKIRVVENLNDTIQHLWYENSVHKFRNYFFDMRARYVDDISRNPILGDITITYPEYYKFDIENVTSTLTKKEAPEYFVNFSADVTETNINLSWIKGDINTVDIDISNNGTSFTSLTTKNSSDSYQITGLQNNQINQFKIKGYYGKTFEFAPIVSTNGAQQDISWPAINDLSGNYEIWKKENSGSSLEFVQSTSSTSISGLNSAYEWKIKGDYNDHPGEYLVSGHIKTSASHPNQLFYEGFETRFFGQTISKPLVISGGSTYGGLYSLTGVNNNNHTWNQRVSNGTLSSGIKSISFWYKSTSPSQSNARILTINETILAFEVRKGKNGLSPRVIGSYPILNRSIFVNGTLQIVSTLGTVNDIYLSPFSHINGIESDGVGFDNNWYHIYVDFKNSFNITSLHWMGGSNTNERAPGVFIDEIRYFDRHLTTKEIQNLSVGGIGKLSIAGDLTLDQFQPLTDTNLKKIDISLNREIGITTNFRTVDLCGNFVVTVNGVNNEISDISANNNILTLTLQNGILKNDVVKVTYTKKTASNEKYKNIIDTAGNELANISETTLTNNITMGAPLPPTSITVTSPWQSTSNYLDFGIKFNQSTAIGNDSGTAVEYNVEYSLNGTTDWISVPGGPDSPYEYDQWQQSTNGFHWTENNIPNSLKNPQSGKPIPGKIVWIRVRAGATFGGQLLWGNYTTFSTYLGVGVMCIGNTLNGLLVSGDEKIRVVLEDSDINYQYVEKYSIIPIEGEPSNPGTIRLDLSKNVSPQTNIPRDINNKANEPLYKTDTGVEITGLTNNQPYHFKLITKMASQTLNPITITDFTLSDKSLADNHDVVKHLKWQLGHPGHAPLATYQDNDSASINTISNKFQYWYSAHTKMFYYNNHLILLGRNGLASSGQGTNDYNLLTVNVITGKIKTGIKTPTAGHLQAGNHGDTFNFIDKRVYGYIGYVWKNKLTIYGGMFENNQSDKTMRFDLDKLTASDFDFTAEASWENGGNDSTWITVTHHYDRTRNFGYGSLTDSGTFLHFGSLTHQRRNNSATSDQATLQVRHINAETFNGQTGGYTYDSTTDFSIWDANNISQNGPTYDNNGVLTQSMMKDGVTFTYGNKLYLYGGEDVGLNIRYDIFEYNSSTRKWKKLSQPTFANGVPDYAASTEVRYDQSITNVNLVTRHQHSAVRIGDKVYIYGGTNLAELGTGTTAVNFEVLVLDFSNYVSNNYVKWYKLDSNYPTELTNLDINNIRFPMMANDPSGNIYITGGTYYKNNTSKLNASPAVFEQYLILKLTIKGKAVTWSSIKDANYKIERSDDGGAYTTKTTAHNSNSYFLASEPSADTKIKVTATITPQKETITSQSVSPVPPASAPNDFQVTTGEQDPTDTESATRNPDHVYKFTFTKYQVAHKYDIEMSFDNINYTSVIETDLIIYDPNAPAGFSAKNPQFTYYLHPGITGYDNNLKEQGTTIWFRIKAAKELSGSYTYGAPSTPIYKTVPVVKPNILSTEIGNRQIEITWADTGGFPVYADISGGQWAVFTVNNPNVTVNNFNYTNLYKGTDYEARFKTAKKSSGSYDKVMRPFFDSTTRKLTWPAIGSQHIIERQVKGTGSFSSIVSHIGGSEYTIPSNISPELDPTDVFRVKYTLLVYSDYSTTGVITTLNAAEPPTNMTFTNVTPNSIKINWVKPTTGANPVKYKIRVSTDDTTYTTLSDNVIPDGVNNSYSHNDLIPGTSYYYKIYSIGSPPNDQDSFPLSGNTNTTLQTPILIGIKTYNIDSSGNTTAVANSGRVDISWNAVPGATEYQVSEKLNNGGYSVKETTSNTSVTFKISHDDPNGTRKQYTYQIKAKKGSVLSEHLETTQIEQLSPPQYVDSNYFTNTKKTNIKNNAKSGKVKIDWELTAGTQSEDTTLEVQRKIEGSNTWVTIARNLNKNLTNFKVKRLKNNKNYSFRVKSIDPLRGTVYTDLEGIKVEPTNVIDTFKTILNTTEDLPLDVSNAIQDLNDAQVNNNIISKITSEGKLPRDAITTVLEKQKTILNTSLAKTGTSEEQGEKKRKLRTETMNMLFSIDENLKSIELTKEDLAFDDNDITFDSSKIKKKKIIAIKPEMNKDSTDITLDLQTFDSTDITQGFYLPMDEEDIANLKFANGNVVKFEKGSEDDVNTKNKTFITDLVGTSTITSTRDGFSMTSPDNYALVNDVVTVNGVEILIGSLYDGRAIPVEEDTSVEKRGYFKHPNSMLNQYHYKMSSIRKLDSLTRSNTGMNFILRNSTHTSPYKKWTNPTPNNNGSMGRLERLKALHQNAKSHPNDK